VLLEELDKSIGLISKFFEGAEWRNFEKKLFDDPTALGKLS
jgi:hypothetical protein